MGIRGTVRRATDGWLVHTNVDTEVIVWEGDEQGATSSLSSNLPKTPRLICPPHLL